MSRKSIHCVNDECAWRGIRSQATALDGPCPKCSSAVELSAPDPAAPSELADLVEVAAEPEPLEVVTRPERAPRRPYLGPPPKHSLNDVRVGPAARQMLASRSGGGRRSLEEVAGEILDLLAAEVGGR